MIQSIKHFITAYGESGLKQACAEYLLTQGNCYVSLDTTQPDVIVPEHLQGGDLILQFAHGLPVPIRDMIVDEKGISGGLSFNRTLYPTYAPWDSVFALSDGGDMGFMFMRDFDRKMADTKELATLLATPDGAGDRKPSGVHKVNPFKVIKGGKE